MKPRKLVRVIKRKGEITYFSTMIGHTFLRLAFFNFRNAASSAGATPPSIAVGSFRFFREPFLWDLLPSAIPLDPVPTADEEEGLETLIPIPPVVALFAEAEPSTVLLPSDSVPVDDAAPATVEIPAKALIPPGPLDFESMTGDRQR